MTSYPIPFTFYRQFWGGGCNEPCKRSFPDLFYDFDPETRQFGYHMRATRGLRFEEEILLPNGWEVGLSNEVCLDTKGNNYEGIGISPDIEITYPRERQGFLNMIINDLNADGDQSINAVFEKLKTE